MEIKKEVLDELIKGYEKPEDLIGETGLLKQWPDGGPRCPQSSASLVRGAGSWFPSRAMGLG